MPRPQRLEYENALYHVMNRGRGRQLIFHGDAYYADFLQTLAEAHERFGLEVHAYCLMGNHYHLLVKTPRANLSRAMRHINGLYTQRFNRRRDTDGPLFRGRFKAILVEADSYLLQLSRYIHRNAVEGLAPLVGQLEDYRWSSYPAYLNQIAAPGWLYREQTYGILGHRHPYAQYKAYVEQGNSEQIQRFYSQAHLSPVLGSDAFKDEVSGRDWQNVTTERLRQQLYEPVPTQRILAEVSDSFGIEEARLLKGKRNHARWIAMYLCQRLSGLSLAEIAVMFGLSSISGVSHSLRRLITELTANPALDRELKGLIYALAP